MRFCALKYFTRHACPERFPLTSEDAKNNDFYEVKLNFHESYDSTHENHQNLDSATQSDFYRVIPLKEQQKQKGTIKGKKYSIDGMEEDYLITPESLKFAKIDVTYYLSTWRVEETDCTNIKLLKMVLWRSLGLMRLDIFRTKIARKIRLWRINKRLRTPLKSKFEIYECLMSSDSFLQTGHFRKSEIVKSLLGDINIDDINITLKMHQSLDWILDASIEDGEIIRISNERDSNPLFKMKGKGIHYFTLTKEQIKNEEHNNQIQRAQVKIQSRMLLLTILLVIATFITAVDKFDAALNVCHQLIEWAMGVHDTMKTQNLRNPE